VFDFKQQTAFHALSLAFAAALIADQVALELLETFKIYFHVHLIFFEHLRLSVQKHIAYFTFSFLNFVQGLFLFYEAPEDLEFLVIQVEQKLFAQGHRGAVHECEQVVLTLEH